jgi:hypothetical protein
VVLKRVALDFGLRSAEFGVLAIHSAFRTPHSAFKGPLRRHIPRVQVMDNGNGIHPIHGLQIIKGLFVKFQRLIVLHIADVLAGYGIFALGERKRILEISAAAQDFRAVVAELNRFRRIAPGTTNERQFRVLSSQFIVLVIPHSAFRIPNSDDRVIHSHKYIPVMGKKGVDDAGEFFECLLIITDDRLLRQISAGHDKRF